MGAGGLCCGSVESENAVRYLAFVLCLLALPVWAQQRPPQVFLDLVSLQVSLGHLEKGLQDLAQEKEALSRQLEEMKKKCGEPCADKR